MPDVTAHIPTSLAGTLEAEARRTRRSISDLITAALGEYLGQPIHTLFQVSTSGALVSGVHSGAICVGELLQHGDLGLGTFADLDGEMVVLDGRAYQARGDGEVAEAGVDALAPFAVVTRFSPEHESTTGRIAAFSELEAACNALRTSGNIFYAFRLDGRFDVIRTRAVSPPAAGAGLLDAAKAQTEFHLSDVSGTLVGLWSPGFSSAFSVAGYHFHFLSQDRRHGGHLLDCTARSLRLQVEALTDFHLALPETAAFLEADLSRNTADELAYAEQAH